MRIHIEGREVEQLHRDLAQAPVRIQRNADRALERGAALVEKAMKADAIGARRSRPSSIKSLPRSSSKRRAGRLTWDVGLGPKPGTIGSIAHIIAHGSVNNAPVYDWTKGPRKVAPEVARLLADAAEESVFGRDLS